jgi:putative ABC transport system permease protein
MAILVSCMGLFGLVAFSAEQRSLETGIRKVLGASATGIVALLSKDLLKLVILSFLIAAPVAGWAMNKWVLDFPYRVSISWWMFALSGLICFLPAFATISLQAVKAAMVNPVKLLRSE